MSETFPHSCRDDHALIGWSGGGELCPLCVAQDRVAELEHLFRPRPYDNNSEAELCPVCNGALDDHRANCVVEMWQVGRACERITALEQCYAALRAAARAVLDDETSDCRKSLAEALEAALADGETKESTDA
jgi:hypothetical protein